MMSKHDLEELEIFNDIKMLNWAWIHETADGTWQQFDCISCMILESKWQQWRKDKKIICKLMIGTIDFNRMIAEAKIDDQIKVLNIMRTENKNRQRPKAEERHMNGTQDESENDKL